MFSFKKRHSSPRPASNPSSTSRTASQPSQPSQHSQPSQISSDLQPSKSSSIKTKPSFAGSSPPTASAAPAPSTFFLTGHDPASNYDLDPALLGRSSDSESSSPYQSSHLAHDTPSAASSSHARTLDSRSETTFISYHQTQNPAPAATGPHPASASVISTDDDVELSSSSSSSSFMNDTNSISASLRDDIARNFVPNAYTFKSAAKSAAATATERALRRVLSHTDSLDGDDDDDDDSDDDENDELAYLPSASISNSTAFTRALNKRASSAHPQSPLPASSSTITPSNYLASASKMKSTASSHSAGSNAHHTPSSKPDTGTPPHAPTAAASGALPTTGSPKFIMPKVSIPSRRPFTTDGLALSKLKILVAGDSGTGKSQLVKAIAQTSKDIIHLNDSPVPVYQHDYSNASSLTVSPSVCKKQQSRRSSAQNLSANSSCASPTTHLSVYDSIRDDHKADDQIAVLWEYLASTRPHLDFSSSSPESEDELSDDNDLGPLSKSRSRPSRRSSVAQSSLISSDSTALEKNVCLVDTLGYGSFADASKCIHRVTKYLSDAFEKTCDLVNPSGKEALTILSSSSSLDGIPIVDVCLYTITTRLKPVDIEYIWQLSQFAPVIPVIVRSDLLPPKELLSLKLSVLEDLHKAKIAPFLFDMSLEESIEIARAQLSGLASRASSFSQDPSYVRPSNHSMHSAVSSESPGSGGARTVESSIVDLGDFSDSNYSPLLSPLESAPFTPSSQPLLFPCAVSTAPDPDAEMLSSVLMASDNLAAALFPSELPDLCAHLFSFHGATWLRHTAAKKFVAWSTSKYVSETLRFQMSHTLQPDGSAAPAASFAVPSEHTENTLMRRDTRNEVVACSRAAPAQQRLLIPLDDENYDFNVIIDLPDIATENRRRAQTGTARWVMEIAQAEGILCYPASITGTTNPRHLIQGLDRQRNVSLHAQQQQLQLRPAFVLRTTRINTHADEADALPNGTPRAPRADAARYAAGEYRGCGGARQSGSITNLDPLDLAGLSQGLLSFTIKALSVAIGIKLLVEIYREVAVVSTAPAAAAAVPAGSGEAAASVVAALSSALTSTAAALKTLIRDIAALPFERLLSAIAWPLTSLFSTPLSSSSSDAPRDAASSILFADANVKGNIRPQSLLAAMFNGDLQQSVFSVLVGSLSGGINTSQF